MITTQNVLRKYLYLIVRKYWMAGQKISELAPIVSQGAGIVHCAAVQVITGQLFVYSCPLL